MSPNKILQEIKNNEALHKKSSSIFGSESIDNNIRQGKDMKEVLKEIKKAAKEKIFLERATL